MGTFNSGNSSIAAQVLAGTKLGKLLYGDNTYTDGYGTTRSEYVSPVAEKIKQDLNGEVTTYLPDGEKTTVTLGVTPNVLAPHSPAKFMRPYHIIEDSYNEAKAMIGSKQRVSALRRIKSAADRVDHRYKG